MRKISAPDITVRHPFERSSFLFIPGGWQLHVPEVTADAAALDIYARYFKQDACTDNVAKERASALVQKVFESGYIKGVRDAIANRALEYAERHRDLIERAKLPSTRKRFYTLTGFEPEPLQFTYIPHQNVGRAGLPFIREMLDEMANAARASSPALAT